jgi:diacylglycerol kinase
MIRFINSFKDACRGIFFVWKEEANFRIQIGIGFVIIMLAYIFPFSLTERVFLLAAVFGVWLSEILNTAFEDMCNKIEPNHDPVIGKIKDMLAGFVLVMSLFSVIVFTTVLASYFSRI